MPCLIPANPDISGIGVRTAIYVQNFLSFVPAISAIWDNKISENELSAAEAQSVTILITAFAILISTIVQSQLFDLSSFHAAIVLNLSWMNNTNTFIYFLLYIHYKGDPDRSATLYGSWARRIWKMLIPPPPIPGRDPASMHIGRRLDDVESLYYDESASSEMHDEDTTSVGHHGKTKSGVSRFLRRRVLRRIVFCLGSLHLTLMASIGLWVWSDPRRFELQSTGNSCSVDNASIAIFGRHVHISSMPLRHFSLVAYSLILTPGLNMLLPVFLFITLRLAYQKLFCPKDPGRIPTLLGLAFLVLVNGILLVDNEISFRRIHPIQEPGEADWTFGQILALLLLCLPLRDVISYSKREQALQQRKRYTDDLNAAIEKKDDKEVSRLVALGADIHVESKGELKTALQVAAFKDNIMLINLLIRKLNGLVDPGPAFGAALNAAACGGSLGAVKILLRCGADPNAVNIDHQTPLHFASRLGDAPMVSHLLDYNANPLLLDFKNCTPADYAANNNSDAVVKLFVDFGAAQNSINTAGDSIMHITAKNGRSVALSCLLRNGARTDATNQHGETPLHLAAGSHLTSTVRVLLKFGAPADAATLDGKTPLHFAASSSSSLNVRLLLDGGADILYQDKRGRTPLHYAASSGAKDTVEILLEHASSKESHLGEGGELAYAEITDNDGRTALHLASDNKKESTISALLAAGARTDIMDKAGETPQAISERKYTKQITDLLREGALRRGDQETSLNIDGNE